MPDPLIDETPFARQCHLFWHDDADGFAVIPRLGKLSLMAFFTAFLVLITAAAVFLEVFSRFSDQLLPYKFGLLLFFIFLAPVFSSLAAVLFRRLLRGLWGELIYEGKEGIIRFSRKGFRRAFARADLRRLECIPTTPEQGLAAGGQLVFVLSAEGETGDEARLFYLSHPDPAFLRSHGQRLAEAWGVPLHDFTA